MASLTPSAITHLWKQVALGEDSALELKEIRFKGTRVSGPHRNSLADEIAAFGNAGGGNLVMGVTDNRRPQGLEPERLDVVVALVDEICADSIHPPIGYSLYRVSAPEPISGGALVITVPESATVHRSPGGYITRTGGSKRQMTQAELQRLAHTRGLSDAFSFDTRIVQRTGVNTLQQELWRQYTSSRMYDPPEVALTKLKFAKADAHGIQRATVGGILLAAAEPHRWLKNAWIQAVRYRGNQPDASDQLDALDITGPVDLQIRRALQFVKSNMRVAAYKAPARTDVPQYSLRAVFEAVVNGVVHRDYSVLGSHIRLFMFSDRLELYSPGGLCNSMTTDDLRSSQFTRNELLASRLGQCPVGTIPGSGGREYFMDRRGEGIAVIEDGTLSLTGRRPVFALVGARELKVTLPAARLPVRSGFSISVKVVRSDTGEPLPNVSILMVHPNNTYHQAQTDTLGRAEFVLYTELPMTFLCAAEGFVAHVETNHCTNSSLEVRMPPAVDGGSQIIAEGTGHLPVVRGRLNPILDSFDRMYLYADNIAINDGYAQPVRFALNEPVRLTDAFGSRATLWFREALGKSFVFDYRFETL